MSILPVLLALPLLSGFIHERTLPFSGNQIELDEIGNIYTVNRTRMEKWSSDGTLLFRSADLNYGDITQFDLSNPLMPFAYYREQAKVVFLDNTLSQQGSTIDLFEKGFLQVEYICGSRGDAFWLWDARMSELIRVDRAFQPLSSTGNLGVVLGLELHPVQVTERGNSVFLVDPELGILIFDIYGTYRTRLPVKTTKPIRVVDDNLLFMSDDGLHILDPTRTQEDVLPLPEGAFESYTFARNRLFLSGGGTTKVYRYMPDVKN